MAKVVTFGEIMGRFSPEGKLRLRQALPGKMVVGCGGAEANVAASILCLGGTASFVTSLPMNPLADSCLAVLAGLGVDVGHVIRTKTGRLGLVFLEHGADQRPSNVVYDRAGSAIAVTPPEAYNWKNILAGTNWLHLTGITPAVSEMAAQATLQAAQQAKSMGLTVSCDLNFRKKLWSYDPALKPRELAEKTMRQILKHVDLVIANEEDASDVLQIHASDTDLHAGKVAVEKYPQVAQKIVEQFPNVQQVAITLRQSISASHNNWGAMLYTAAQDKSVFAPTREGSYCPYEIRTIVDRVGGGDAFAGALIFALQTPELAEPSQALAFAVASSCLAHTIEGDFNYSSRGEVEALMKGSGSGRVVR